MISKLDLYILNSDNSVAPFPSEAEQIVLYDFAFEAQRMGSAPEITASIQANGSLENALTTKVFCEYNGERYFLKNLPSSSKENTNPQYTFDLTFVSERTILDNVYMIDAVQGDSNIDRYQSNSTNIVFMGTIEELIARLNASMIYTGVGYSVVLDEGIATESKLVSFQDKVFTEALQEGVKIFNVPYYYVGKIIHFGYSQTTIPTLKYGDGLLSINKSIRTERIVNRATATGSTENIPYYYPNPTPKGFINPSITDKSGAGISVINEAKLSRLGEGEKLAYYEYPEVEVIDTYFSEDYNTVIPPYVPVFDWEKKSVKNGNVRPFNMSYFISGLSVKSTKDETMDVFINFYLSYASSAAKYVEFKDVIAYVKEGDALIIDTSLHPQISGGGILIPDFPTNAERYIAVIYYNNSYNTYRFDFNFSSNYYLSSGWYISDGNDRINNSEVNIFDYGVSVSNTPKEGDEVSYKVIKKIPFATSLMPSIYRETDGAQRFYNAINGAYEGVTFENEYSEVNPKEAITKFEDIKPTIVGVTNANGERIDMFAEFAYDLNDSDETELTAESSESFIHPYFYAKLHKIDGNNGFNLFAQAIESGEMTIEMTSGHCGACKFVIAVDENTQRNLVMVDNNGDLIYDEATGKVQMANDATGLDRQNDTRNYEVWIALKKDISTYGHIMPMANSTIKPNVNDTFVITNILLPQAYFTAAEKKLEDEIIAFLVKDNAFQFDYDINFSRIFLKKRNDVLSALSENALIPIEYNGKKLSFYVSSYTYRKQKGEVLPEISVSLTDNLESTPSAFQQTISAIQENIAKGIGAAGLTFEDTDPRYLRKDVADTVKERITFDKGLDFRGSLTSKGFKKGNLIGAGFGVYEDGNGNTVVEADRMVIRKDAQFSEIVINQTTFQLGTTVFSGGGCNITNVEEVEGAYRCYYDNKSGTRFSGFVVGDQARCQRFDESFGGVIKYYWRLVVAVGTDYVDLSKTDVDGGGIPESGDDIVNFGNRTDKSRQNAIVINPLNGGSVEVYAGINSFSLEDKNYVGMGVNPNTNEAYMYGYGDIYIGDRNIDADDATFVTYQKKEGESKRKVFISADVNLGKNSTGLSNLSEFQDVQQTATQAKQDAKNAEASAKSYADELVKDLQKQLDGKVESFFYDYDPTTSNIPASEWTTNELKKEHLNDTFTNTESGQSWRWLLKDGVYQWVAISDTLALQMAQEALNLANSKVTIFTETPKTPYKVKDLWFQGEGGNTKRCIKARTEQETYNADDWVNADDYKDFASSVAGDAEQNAKNYANEQISSYDLTIKYLKDAFNQGSVLDVNGVTLSALVGVKDKDEKVVAGLYGGGSNTLNNAGYADSTHKAMLLFAGIEGVDKPKTYKTAIFEDGFLQSTYFATAKEGKRVVIFGNELKVYGDDANNSVLSISYDYTGKPRLQYTDKSGKVSWYLSDSGISTSYTVEQADRTFVNVSGSAQSITTQHNFANGLKIDGISLRKVDNHLYIDSSLVLSGGVTMYGDDGTTVKPIWESIPFDRTTIDWVDGKWTVVGGVGGGGISEEFLNVTLQGYQPLLSATNKLPYSLISGTPSIPTKLSQLTDDVVAGNYLSTKGGTVNGNVIINDVLQSKSVQSVRFWNTPDLDDVSNWESGLEVRGVGFGPLNIPNNAHSLGSVFENLNYDSNAGNQVYYSTYTNDVFYRSRFGGSWRDWRRFAFTSDIPTKLSQLTDDVVAGNYLSLTGGTVNGSITLNNPTSHTPFEGAITLDAKSYGSESYSQIRFKNGSDVSTRYGFINLKGSTYGHGSGVEIGRRNDDSIIIWASIDASGITAPSFIGKLTGNADSATKLATARTIWGQSFDGTGNLMSDNGVGLMSATQYYGFSVLSDNSIYGVRTFLTYDEGVSMGAYEIAASYYAGGLAISVATGLSYDTQTIPSSAVYTPAVVIKSNGNVAIGGTTADAKLHVHGTAKFNGDATFSSKVVIGTIPVYQSADGTLFVDANVVFRGGVAMYGNTTTTINEE